MLFKHFIFCNRFQATNKKGYKEFLSVKLSSFSYMNEEYENLILQNYLVDLGSKF